MLKKYTYKESPLCSALLLGYLYKKRLVKLIGLRHSELAALIGCVVFFKGGVFSRNRFYENFFGRIANVDTIAKDFNSLVASGYLTMVRPMTCIGFNKRSSAWFRVSDKGNELLQSIEAIVSKEVVKLSTVDYSFTKNKGRVKKGSAPSNDIIDY